MLRFQVYSESGAPRDWPLAGAFLSGPGDVPAPAKITFEDGAIVCRKRTPSSAALNLQYDAGRMGRLLLQTCLLPERDRPYSLTVELARHRIKLFIAKCEEWQLFGLGDEHPAVARWQEARALFSRALYETDPATAEKQARASLMTGIEATERLALAHAEILLHWRFGSRPAPSTTLGVRVRPERDSPPLREIVRRDFDLLVIPLSWAELEVEEGTFNWEPIDRWLEWARAEGKPVILGPLLDFSRRALPKWMYVWQHDYNTCRDMVYEQVQRVVKRYRSLVGTWNIAAGLNVNDNFEFTPEQMLDLTRMANLIVRENRKGARTMVELVQPFGEYLAENRGALPPLTYIERLSQDGIRVDCLGVQLLFGGGGEGRATRDLMEISDLLDRFAPLETPVVVSAFGAPHEAVDERGGWWHEPWTPALQSRWMTRVFAVAMSKPFVDSVVWADLFDDPRAELPKGGLVTEQGKPKPVLERLVSTRKRLRKPLGPLKERDRESTRTPPQPA